LKIEHKQSQLQVGYLKEDNDKLSNHHHFMSIGKDYDKLSIIRDQLECKITEIKEDYHNNLRNYQNSLVLLKSSQDTRKKLQKQMELLYVR